MDTTWLNLNIENNTLVVPKSENGQMRIIYLNDDAVGIFRAIQNTTIIGCNEYISSSERTEKPINVFSIPGIWGVTRHC